MTNLSTQLLNEIRAVKLDEASDEELADWLRRIRIARPSADDTLRKYKQDIEAILFRRPTYVEKRHEEAVTAERRAQHWMQISAP